MGGKVKREQCVGELVPTIASLPANKELIA